jgi:hypothetical protein
VPTSTRAGVQTVELGRPLLDQRRRHDEQSLADDADAPAFLGCGHHRVRLAGTHREREQRGALLQLTPHAVLLMLGQVAVTQHGAVQARKLKVRAVVDTPLPTVERVVVTLAEARGALGVGPDPAFELFTQGVLLLARRDRLLKVDDLTFGQGVELGHGGHTLVEGVFDQG